MSHRQAVFSLLETVVLCVCAQVWRSPPSRFCPRPCSLRPGPTGLSAMRLVPAGSRFYAEAATTLALAGRWREPQERLCPHGRRRARSPSVGNAPFRQLGKPFHSHLPGGVGSISGSSPGPLGPSVCSCANARPLIAACGCVNGGCAPPTPWLFLSGFSWPALLFVLKCKLLHRLARPQHTPAWRLRVEGRSV